MSLGDNLQAVNTVARGCGQYQEFGGLGQLPALGELHHFGMAKIIRAKNLWGLPQRHAGCLCSVKKTQCKTFLARRGPAQWLEAGGGDPALPPQWRHVWVLSFHCVYEPQRCCSLQQSCCLCRGTPAPAELSRGETAACPPPTQPAQRLPLASSAPGTRCQWGRRPRPAALQPPRPRRGTGAPPNRAATRRRAPAVWGGGGRGVPLPVAPGPRVLADRWRWRISLGDRPRERCPSWQPGGPGVPRQHPAGGREPPGPGTTRPQQPRARRRVVPGKGSVDFIAQAG